MIFLPVGQSNQAPASDAAEIGMLICSAKLYNSQC
jgi:hypothetical protein